METAKELTVCLTVGDVYVWTHRHCDYTVTLVSKDNGRGLDAGEDWEVWKCFFLCNKHPHDTEYKFPFYEGCSIIFIGFEIKKMRYIGNLSQLT